MTDFFDRLLARQRPLDEPGEVTRARSRVPALFERSRDVGLEELVVERDAAAPAEIPVAPRSADPVAPRPWVAPAAGSAPDRPRSHSADDPAPAAAQPAAVPPMLDTDRGPAAAFVPDPVRPPHPPSVPAAPLLSPPGAAVVRPLPVSAPRSVAPAAPRAAAAPSPTPQAPAPQPAPGRARRPEPPGRTVSIHIGRIELSAAAAPEPETGLLRRHAPALSLDKYLGEAR
jgi:hypothetical protein